MHAKGCASCRGASGSTWEGGAAGRQRQQGAGGSYGGICRPGPARMRQP